MISSFEYLNLQLNFYYKISNFYSISQLFLQQKSKQTCKALIISVVYFIILPLQEGLHTDMRPMWGLNRRVCQRHPYRSDMRL